MCPRTMGHKFGYSIILPIHSIFSLLHFSHSGSFVVTSHCDFNLLFLVISDENLLMCLSAIHTSFFVKTYECVYSNLSIFN